MAQDMLERYLVIRQLYPQWFSKLDVDDPIISDILDSGWVTLSLVRPFPRFYSIKFLVGNFGC